MRIAIAPFFLQSLRSDARSGKTYLVRAVMAAFLLLMLVSVHERWQYVAAPGLDLFSSIVWTTAFITCLAGPFYFASVITEEKENKTIGLLKMTALRPAWILMGKSTSQMIAAGMLLLTQVPLVLLSVTLGGVSLRQIAAAYCALAAHLVLVANLGMLFSTLGRTLKRAVTGTSVCLLGFFLLVPLGQHMLGNLVGRGSLSASGLVYRTLEPLLRWANDSSVFTRGREVLSTGFSGSPIGFQVLTNLGAGGVFFLLAWAVFDRCTRDHQAGTPGRGLLFMRTSRLRGFGAGRAWRSALVWKDYHFLVGGKGFALVKFLLLGALLGGIYLLQRLSGYPPNAEEFGDMTLGIMIAIIALQLVAFHERILGSERRWHTLPNLLMLPCSAWGLVWRKLLGCLLGLLPDLLWFGFGARLHFDGLVDLLEEVLSEPGAWYALGAYAVLLQLALYLPLRVRRGALLLAFVLWIAGLHAGAAIVMSLTGGYGSEDTFLGLLAALVFALAVFLHWRTMRRLVRQGGAE
ncbi:MAG: hypothetical protein GXY85_08615 [Candidatus Brocadiaceae bacterium]|nr:hypothetical protein [Candidatus Brocadiaceae bacterium]